MKVKEENVARTLENSESNQLFVFYPSFAASIVFTSAARFGWRAKSGDNVSAQPWMSFKSLVSWRGGIRRSSIFGHVGILVLF